MVGMETTRERLRIRGKITINTYRAGMVEAVTPLLDEIRALRASAANFPPTDIAISILERIERLEAIKATYFLRTAVECPNLVMDSPGYGLDLIIQRLVGINTYSLNLAYIELGTGTATPTVNDTALTTPSIRLPVSFQQDYGATDAIVQAYVSDANLPNGTYTEVGAFVDGSATVGSGQIFNHSLLSSSYSKVSGQDTTLNVDINITNS
jgi:hypothetical protein